MQAALLVEDRDLAFLFLDPHCAHHDAVAVEAEIADGVTDIENEDHALWLFLNDNKLRVVLREGFDFKAQTEETGFVVPTPVVVMDRNAYNRFCDEDES